MECTAFTPGTDLSDSSSLLSMVTRIPLKADCICPSTCPPLASMALATCPWSLSSLLSMSFSWASLSDPSVFASVTATGSPWSSTMTVLLLWDSKNSCAASGLISPSGAGTARPPMPLSPPVSSAVATDTGRTSVRTPAVASSFLLRKVLPFLVRGTRTGPRRLPSLPPISVSPVRMGKQRRIAH